MTKNLNMRTFLFIVFLFYSFFAFSQKSDTTKTERHFGGSVLITTKGISTIPNLTLGKPAAIFDLSIGAKRLSFEPQFRFALEGKPWTFLFWGRYKLVEGEKFRLSIGTHPAIAFKTITINSETGPQQIIRTTRYLAGEMTPTYLLSKNVAIGFYYLYSHGIESDITKNTNFIAFRLYLSNIRLTDQFYLRFNPQLYFLKMDKNHGYYFNSTLVLAKRNFPVAASILINKVIKTDIPLSTDLIWNASLTYSFGKDYVKK
jgi:hypothetical protein